MEQMFGFNLCHRDLAMIVTLITCLFFQSEIGRRKNFNIPTHEQFFREKQHMLQ